MEQRNFREIIPGVSDILTLRQPTARGERAANGVFDPIKARPLRLAKHERRGGGKHTPITQRHRNKKQWGRKNGVETGEQENKKWQVYRCIYTRWRIFLMLFVCLGRVLN